MGASKTSTAKKPSTTAVAAYNRRLCWPWPQLPPTTPMIYTTSLKSQMWPNINTTPPAITKSRPPATTRCNNAHLRLHLHHHLTTTGNACSPIAEFLDDSTIDAKTMYESKNESYWCVLRFASMHETTHPPPPPPPPPILFPRWFDLLGPHWMTILGLSFTNFPTSGLVVNYSSVSTGLRNYKSKYFSIRHECSTIDPFDPKKKPIEFTGNIIRYRRRNFYAMSLQGTLVVMEEIDHRLKITGMSATRAIPSSNWRFFKEYMVEMDGEIFLIFLIYEKSLAVVDRVEVFRLDLIMLGWIKVERLGGKTMFLKEKCICVNSAELGCRDDCVYFVQGSDEFWRVFDLKNGCFSTVLFED